MEPKLSLNYSSGGGNGYMGVGWSIGGASAITRCPQTKAVDGASHKFGVKYNSNDRFCLDGQRLINVTGAYGADGTVYRTEIDTYSKIVSRGSYGGDPKYFDVYTKSGLRYIYGEAATTYQFNKPGVAMKLWKVDRIIDTYNNQISFNYAVDYINGIHRLNKVTYADNIIQYKYEPRSDVIKGYHGGYPFLINNRLKEVIVKTGTTEVRRYRIAYTKELNGAKRSNVSSITEHVSEGNLKNISFLYSSEGSILFSEPKNWINAFGTIHGAWGTERHKRQFVDVNGDGLADLVGFGADGPNVALNTGSEFSAPRNWINAFGTIHGAWGTERHKRQFVDVNGDGLPDLVGFGADGPNVALNQAKKPLLTHITNGIDQDIKITYKPMTDSSIYHNYSTHGQRNIHAFNKIANDNIELSTSQSLVHSVNSNNGIGGDNQIRYRYYGYIFNKLRGFQGFHAIDTYDDTSRMKSVNFYAQIAQPNGAGFQYTGMPAASYAGLEYGTSWDYWLSRTTIQYKDASKRSKIYEPYAHATVQTIHEPGTTTAIQSIYHNNYLNTDGLGNINKTIDKTEDYINRKSFTKTTTNEYTAENESAWHIGRLTKATVVHNQTDGGTVTRSSTFKYNPQGVLREEIANDGTNLALKKTYTYDAKGNKNSETISGSGVITAQTRYDYGTQYGGKFLTHIDYADGTYQMIPTYDERFGMATSSIDLNGLRTRWTYDGMGRKTLENRADGTWNKWEHLWYGIGDIKNIYVCYMKETQSGTTHHTSTFYDSLGRETAKDTSTLGDKIISRYKYYNAKGELYKETLPYVLKQESASYILTTYDKYGRATQVSKPGPNGTTQIYTMSNSNFTSISTNPKGQKKKTVQNAIGQTISITDAYGSTVASSINYKYDSVGNLKETTDSEGHKILMTYDELGNKTYMKDPDLGVWYYTYNAAGKVIKQWSGTKGYSGSKQATYKVYDVLGRLIRTNTRDLDRSKVTRKTSYNYKKFTYGNANAAVGSKGKLLKLYASSKMKGKDWHAETKTIIYDSLGRPKSSNTSINNRGEYLTSTTYDAYSRPSTITYPNGYKIINHYNNGILDYVKGSDGKIHYKIQDINAFGEVTKSLFSNNVVTSVGHDSAGFVESIRSGQNGSYYTGNVQQVRYTYDGLGNVVSRNDDSIDSKYLRETFTYDDMNRLTGFNVSTDITKEAFRNSRTYTYDRLGNMTSKTGYGNYRYASDKPHAVTKVGSRSYAYDKVGNMTNRNGDSIIYNPLSKPAILKNKNGKEVRFYYGVGGQRFMKVTDKKQTFYLGKGYEEEQETASQEVKSTIYIKVRGKTVGTHVEVLDQTYVSTNPKHKNTYNRYFHTDALGSITAITDDMGEVVERRSYEPFGKIRAMDYGLTENNAIIPAYTVSQTSRAFTGHEQIAELAGLIHMNGRVYDSAIGRFLSADTIIQAPYDSQAYNRYSYVRNNPLVFTDPTGHSWLSKLWKKIKPYIRTIVAIVVAVVIAIYAPYLLAEYGGVAFGTTVAGATTLTFVGTVAVGALAGFASGAIMTGTLKGALQGALLGGLSAGVLYGVSSATSSLFKVDIKHSVTKLMKAGMHKAAAFKSVANGLSRALISKLQGGDYRRAFWMSVGSSALRALYVKVSTINNYNKSGNPHMWQEGKSDVGSQLKPKDLLKVQNGIMPAPFDSDQSGFMKGVGKYVPYGDAFAEFHDGLHSIPGMLNDQLSLIVTMPLSYLLTVVTAVAPYANTYTTVKDMQRRYR